MKVLYILHVAQMHGSTISILNTIKGVKSKGIEPIVVIPDSKLCDESFKKSIEELRIKTYIIPLALSVFKRDEYYTWSIRQKIYKFRHLYVQKYQNYKLLSKIVKIEKPHIIHTNVGVIHEGFWVAKKYRIPHIFHIREYQDKDIGWKIVPSKSCFCWILKRSNVITITSALKSYFGLEKRSNALTIYNGIYSRTKTSMVFPKEDYFFCASRVSKEKGIDEVIIAFALFCKTHPNYKLLIAGTGDIRYLERLYELASNNNCRDKVHFLGSINDVYGYMQKARALIVGSHYEGFGRMTAEAAFAGCLVIGRNTGGTKEIIDRIGGYKFNTVEELITSMNTISVLTETTYREMAHYAQNQAIESFSIEQNVEKTLSIYHSIT